MDSANALRVEAYSRNWNGQNASSEDRKRQRARKLKDLLDALIEGNLEGARQAFVALINFDPTVAQDPYLSKISSALQSSNLYAAQHFAKELNAKGAVLQSHSQPAKPQKVEAITFGSGLYKELKRINLQA